MSSTIIGLSAETKRLLDTLKRDDESYEAVIRRLALRDRWTGFGAFEEADADDAAAGLAAVRADLEAESADRIERLAER
ncbi:sugar metabolism cluster protein [Halobaculum sp. MBLA0147]|uniref:DUF7557 family protein n=1 Tax=Halobaculum sp. MBLA0147 TaxID=3079934 RepID=UPI0035243CE8